MIDAFSFWVILLFVVPACLLLGGCAQHYKAYQKGKSTGYENGYRMGRLDLACEIIEAEKEAEKKRHIDAKI